jgi:hypothetical protein
VTLIEVLHEVLPRLIAGQEQIVIARGDAHEPLDGGNQAFQFRLRRNQIDDHYTWHGDPRCETRSWLGGQWSEWRERYGWLGGPGFDIRDVLATDWRILP